MTQVKPRTFAYHITSGAIWHTLAKLPRTTPRTEYDMEMKKINAGKLRAIGYDAHERLLRVEFEDGSAIDYSGVNGDLWRRFSTSGVAWSFYRDNIEDEFTGRKSTVKRDADQRRKLEDLFGPPGGETDA